MARTPYPYFFLIFIFLTFPSMAFASPRFKIVTTFTIIQDLATEVAGEVADVESITRPGVEIHNYQPTPGDIIRTQRADLVLWNGLHLESWFVKFFGDVQNVPQVVVTEGIIAIPGNPHAWMSPKNILIYIENIRRALVKYDPANEAIYNANAKNYSAKIVSLGEEIRKKFLSLSPERRWLVTSEGAFTYLTEYLDLKEAYLWSVNADQQGTPQQLKRVIDLVREKNIPVVFSESTVSDKPARQVAKETGARYGGILYVDSLSGAQGPVPTYIKLIEVTTSVIFEGLSSDKK